MTSYTVSAGHVGVEPWTMTASQVDTVTFTDEVGHIAVISDGAAELRVSNDGSAPAIGAAGASTSSFRIPAGTVGVLEIPMRSTKAVKVVSSGTPKVSVQIAT